jgi:hypothetical protein
MARKLKCKLCSIKRPHWEEESFFGVQCKEHCVPVIIIKKHKKSLSKTEQEELRGIMEKRFNGWFPNKSLSTSSCHWNLYLTRKGGK